MRKILADLGSDVKLNDFSDLLKAEGKINNGKKFKKMEKSEYDTFKKLIQQINSKRKIPPNRKFRKLMRL